MHVLAAGKPEVRGTADRNRGNTANIER